MGGVTAFLNIVAATGGVALLLYSTDALFYYTDERYASCTTRASENPSSSRVYVYKLDMIFA